jgi:SSS family solute:Na+ symporter
MVNSYWLVFIGIPVAYNAVGYDAIKATLDPKYLSTNVTWYQILNWSVTIIPIWFVGMTLYQRIYASKGPKEAKKAWIIAGCSNGVAFGLFLLG